MTPVEAMHLLTCPTQDNCSLELLAAKALPAARVDLPLLLDENKPLYKKSSFNVGDWILVVRGTALRQAVEWPKLISRFYRL